MTREVKDGGYHISDTIKKVWKVQLDLALEVKRICEKYDIKYFIIWGTLLGAVRHGGFIPWDDDLDIGFLREDYEKFIEIAKKEIKSPIFIQNYKTDKGYYIPYSRLRNSNTTGIIYANIPYPYNNGIFIDLYPLDVVVENKLLRTVQYSIRDFIRVLCEKYYAEIRHEKKPRYVDCIKKLISYDTACRWMDKICRLGELFNGKEIGLVYHPELIRTYKFNKEFLGNLKKIKFENHTFSAPEYCEEVLSQVYGDYMKLPPPSKRGRWHEGEILYNPDVKFDEFIRGKKKIAYYWNEEAAKHVNQDEKI